MTITSMMHSSMLFHAVRVYQERSQGLIRHCIFCKKDSQLDCSLDTRSGGGDLAQTRTATIQQSLHLPTWSWYVSFTLPLHTSKNMLLFDWVELTFLSIAEFGITLGVWQLEELEILTYVSAVRDFIDDVSTA